MDGLEKEYSGRIRFTRVNILDKDNAALIQQYGVSGTPELYLLNRDGVVISSWDEVGDGDGLRQTFDHLLAGGS